MKIAIVLALISIGILSGCLMTTKRGEYAFNIRKTVEKRAEISGSFYASAFVDWGETRYGREPKALIHLLVEDLLSAFPTTSYEISDVRFTKYGPGSNEIGWSAMVSGGEDVMTLLKSKIGKRIEGDFSFEDARLLQVRNERSYP